MRRQLVKTFVIAWNGDQTYRVIWLATDRGHESAEAICDVDDMAMAAAQVVKLLDENGYAGQRIVLAVPSRICLCAALACDEDATQDYAALAYQLEERLPIPAEAWVADFVPVNGQLLGCAIPLDRVSALVAALEQVGVPVDYICPDGLLAVQGLILGGGEVAGESLYLWQREQSIEAVFLHDNRLATWKVVAHSSSAIRSLLAGLAIPEEEANTRVLFIGMSRDREVAVTSPLPHATALDIDLDWAMATAARSLLLGDRVPWVNFRRESLASSDPRRSIRKQLNFLFAGFVILLLSVANACLWRSYRYAAEAQRMEMQAHSVYRQLYPAESVPDNYESVLASALAELREEQRAATYASPKCSALHTLFDVLQAIPPDTKFTLQQIDVTAATITLQGTVTQIGDANQIAEKLRQLGYQATLPSDAYQFTVQANRKERE